MLKKVLMITSLMALSTTLSSCTYVSKSLNKFRSNKSTECATPICEDKQAESEVQAAPVEEIIHNHHKHHHDHMHREVQPNSVTTVSEDGLKEITCTETTYTSAANRVQTLGYIPADSCLPELKASYTPVVHKKVQRKPKITKPKSGKADSYNATKTKATETTTPPVPAVEETQQLAPAPVNIEEKPTTTTPTTPTESPKTEPQPMHTPQNTTTTQTVTPLAPAPIATPEVPVAPPAPTSSTTPVPSSPAIATKPAADVAGSSPNPQYSGTANHQQLTASPMTNEQAPATNTTVSVGRLATLDYSESQVDIPSTGTSTLDQIAEDLKKNPGKNVKIQSYAYSKDGNTTEARRNSLQRAIKVRKYLIDKDVSASRISVNAIEDINNKLNKVEISFEESKQ